METPCPALGPLRAAELEQIFTNELKPSLWTGGMSLSEFWERLAVAIAPGASSLPQELQRELADDLRPLPAISRVVEWACRVHVALLSNHVSEWLEPHIARFGLRDACDFILVSDQTGLRKPDRRAFQCALDQWLKPPNTVLYVDDNETNFVVASEMGMSTLLATPTGRWEREVDRWIECWVGNLNQVKPSVRVTMIRLTGDQRGICKSDIVWHGL